MSAADIVADLSRLGIQLWVESDQLRFKAPQGVLTPELRTKLVEQKSDLLAFLRQVQSSIQSSGTPPIRPAARLGDMPLSYAQERLWFIDQWEPGTAAYNVYDAISIRGNVELTALERSINEIVRRHEILRTTFIAHDGQSAQRIADELTLTIPVISLQQYSGSDKDAELQRLISAETSRPFDLSAGPLMRVVIFRLEEEQHILLFNLHHIVSDGWTTGVLIKEMAALYDAFTRGRPSPLPELGIQYADFAAWQREWLKGARLESERAFWKGRLNGAPASLELPTDRPRPRVRTSRGATHEISLSPALSAGVRRLAQQERITPYVVLLSAWAALLWRYTGQDEIVIGSPHANRNRTELEELIGFFVNTLVLRADLSRNPTFLELLERLRDVTISAQEHQDLPFEKLVEELHLERDLSRTPLFQVAFVFQNAPSAEMAVTGLTIRRLKLPTETSKFDLTLTVMDSEPSMEGEVEYSTDLFDEATILRMAGHFERLLDGFVEDPHRKIGEIDILSEQERRQLFAEWNATSRDYPKDAFIHQMFERQALLTPNNVAAIFGEHQISYQELNEKANQLAHYLITRRAGPDVPVGICVNRSIEMIVGLLGVLKAGGAYIPLDPTCPDQRLAYMVEDCKASLILTQESFRQIFSAIRAEVICLDAGWDAIAIHDKHNPAVSLSEDNLAYVIYTSGSTGQPKAAMNVHGAISNRLLWMQDQYKLQAKDRVLQKTPFSFDVSVWELFWPLMTGAAQVIAKPDGHRDSKYLIELIQHHGVTVLHFVPSMLEVFLQEKDASLCNSLRLVVCSGEALWHELQLKAFETLPEAELHNLYGPTEAAVDVTWWKCEPNNADRAVPIGRPISNTQMYILDKQVNPVPVGVAGELYIAGNNLGRGYLNRPDLTAERFIPDPYGEKAGGRLYKTGDIARYDKEGRIHYLGRADHQVKLRGFRIELGEIESVLMQHEQIREAVVTVQETDGGKRLVGYVVASGQQKPDVNELKVYLKQRLPDYMTPAVFVTLESMPLTPNGKLDRRALPAPGRNDFQGENKYVAPRTLVEDMLVAIWEDLLKVNQVGIYHSFFDLGGHSLLAIQLMARVNRAFHSNLALRVLFESPTVSGLAEQIEKALASGEGREIPQVEPIPRQGPPPASFSQENLWLFEQLSPGTPT
ncbi:MAG: amino acid adenylation domain-containing protein, partial [Blastocatellia bacterium]